MRFSLVVCLFLAAGCKDSTKDFEQLADRACACPQEDTACGNKVLADLVTFAEHNKSSDGDQRRITEAGVRLDECLVNAGVKQTELTAALGKMIE